MCAKWAKDLDATALLARVESSAVVTGSNVSFKLDAFEFHEIEAILAESVDYHPGIVSPLHKGLVWTGLVACAKKSDFSAKSFIAELSRAEGAYFAQPERQYHFFTSMSIEYAASLSIPSFDGVVARVYRALPSTVDRNPIAGQIRHILGSRPHPQDYAHLRLAVRGRSGIEAGERAIQVAELQRAILNFQINLTKGLRVFSGRPESVNLILPGPISTLHDRSGALVDDSYWFEPDYVAPRRVVRVSDLEPRRRNEEWLVEKLRKHRYRSQVEDALRRYSRALDHTNYDLAIVQCWSVLERLMASDKYETVVKRTSFLFEEFEHHRLVLNHIRRYRNRVIHSGHSSSARNEIVHQLRDYVQQAILFHVRNPLRSVSMEEGISLLELPPALKELRRRRQLLEFAIRYRRG